VERFTHDHAGNKLSESDANGNTTFSEHDRLNRLTKRTDADGNVVELDYDEAGNTLVERDVIRGLRTEGAARARLSTSTFHSSSLE
jgi:YD repeat-containing protein